MDLKPLLIPASALNEKAGVIKQMQQDHLLEQALDNELIKQVGGRVGQTDGRTDWGPRARVCVCLCVCLVVSC